MLSSDFFKLFDYLTRATVGRHSVEKMNTGPEGNTEGRTFGDDPKLGRVARVVLYRKRLHTGQAASARSAGLDIKPLITNHESFRDDPKLGLVPRVVLERSRLDTGRIATASPPVASTEDKEEGSLRDDPKLRLVPRIVLERNRLDTGQIATSGSDIKSANTSYDGDAGESTPETAGGGGAILHGGATSSQQVALAQVSLSAGSPSSPSPRPLHRSPQNTLCRSPDSRVELGEHRTSSPVPVSVLTVSNMSLQVSVVRLLYAQSHYYF